jgi:hypothetical protein
MRVSGDRTTQPVAAVSGAGGGVLVRGLMHRLAARGEAMPVQHALAIVVSAASKVHAAHIAGGRLISTLETVLVKFDGTVEIEAPAGGAELDGIHRSDVVALGALLAELVRGAAIPDGLAEAFSTAIDVEQGPESAGELAQALAFAAKAAKIPLSRGELGRWAKRQVHPPRLAHTLRRDSVPELGVDLGAVKPKPKGDHGKLAVGSGTFKELLPEEPDDSADLAIDVDLDDLIEAAVAPPAMAAVTLPIPPELAPRPRGWGPALLALLAVVLILGGAGVLYFYR